MKTVYIGIDPGLKGFITVLESDEEITFHPIPTINKGKELDSIFLAGLLKGIVERYKEHRVVVGVENVHALFGASAGRCSRQTGNPARQLGPARRINPKNHRWRNDRRPRPARS